MQDTRKRDGFFQFTIVRVNFNQDDTRRSVRPLHCLAVVAPILGAVATVASIVMAILKHS